MFVWDVFSRLLLIQDVFERDLIPDFFWTKVSNKCLGQKSWTKVWIKWLKKRAWTKILNKHLDRWGSDLNIRKFWSKKSVGDFFQDFCFWANKSQTNISNKCLGETSWTNKHFEQTSWPNSQTNSWTKVLKYSDYKHCLWVWLEIVLILFLASKVCPWARLVMIM